MAIYQRLFLFGLLSCGTTFAQMSAVDIFSSASPAVVQIRVKDDSGDFRVSGSGFFVAVPSCR